MMIIEKIMRCVRSNSPFTYLVISLRKEKLGRQDWRVIIEKTSEKVRRLAKEFSFNRGRLTLLDAVLTVISVYILSMYRMPIWVIKRIDQIRRKFL